jgi:hypothetical protein
VTTDYAGVTREAPADFGAFEFETAAPPSTTHYIKPNGNDAADGSSEANAWKTFGHALPLLQPGHTLIVMDGTYTKAINGVPRLDCTSTTVNGTASQPITVQAQNERQAHITSDGTVNPLNIRFCSYWTFEGLYLQHADNTTQESLNSGDVVFVRQSDRLTFRRLLLQHPNATAPTGHDGFHVELSTDCLIEENELYDMAQHGFLLDGHSTMPLERNVLRRNYLHARQAGAQTGIGIALTEAKRNIIENNIIEGFGTGIEQYYGPGAVQNRYLGNVVLSSGKTRVGLRLTSDAQASNGPAVTGVDQMPQTTEITHLSVLGASTTGVQLTSTKNTTLRNITLLDGGGNGLVVDLHSDPAARGDGAPSVSGANLMIANNAGTGIVLDTTTSVDLQYVWAFGNGTAASPALTDGRYSHTFTTDPLLSACFVGIPNGSGACLAGSLGESIGAHIATRYADGTLTPSVLWDASTHEFPCGAVLTGGINDGGGQSCTDVHTRLHVSAGGCTFESPAACLNTSPPPLRHHGRGHYETSTVFGFPY